MAKFDLLSATYIYIYSQQDYKLEHQVMNIIHIYSRRFGDKQWWLSLFVTLKKVYDRNVMNKYGLYSLLGVIIYNLVDYISICTDAELFIIYIYICEQ